MPVNRPNPCSCTSLVKQEVLLNGWHFVFLGAMAHIKVGTFASCNVKETFGGGLSEQAYLVTIAVSILATLGHFEMIKVFLMQRLELASCSRKTHSWNHRFLLDLHCAVYYYTGYHSKSRLLHVVGYLQIMFLKQVVKEYIFVWGKKKIRKNTERPKNRAGRHSGLAPKTQRHH